jgi:hypothetical protein
MKIYFYHNAPTVKPDAATAVELLMMGVRTPEHVELYINFKYE